MKGKRLIVDHSIRKVRSSFSSIFPVSRPSMKLHNGKNQKFSLVDPIKNSKGESIDEASSRMKGDGGPSLGKTADSIDSRINFLGKFQP